MTEFFSKPIFHGRRFDSHTLPIDVLKELQAYQDAVVQLAAVIWRREHPARVRLPMGFENGCKLTIESIDREAGCVGVVLGLLTTVGGSPQMGIEQAGIPYKDYYTNGRDELEELVQGDSSEGTVRALPAKARRALSYLGGSLNPDEFILLGKQPVARDGARLRPGFGQRFAESVSLLWEDVELEGIFDSRSLRDQKIGIFDGDISHWNQYLDHKVRVYGVGVVGEDETVLEVVAVEKVVLAEPAKLSIQFDRLRRWNDPPLNHGMLERFENLLRELEAIVVLKPSLYPTEEGEARAEWSRAPWEVSITASVEDATFRMEMLNNHTDGWSEHTFRLSDLDEIKNLLAETLVGVNNAGE